MSKWMEKYARLRARMIRLHDDGSDRREAWEAAVKRLRL